MPRMWCLDWTLNTPAENLAADEALLDWCGQNPHHEVLRLWESADYFVVLGRSNIAAIEVDLPACQSLRIPVLRRSSGGGTVLQGPGCLSYALILSLGQRPELASITRTNRHIMEEHRALLAPLTGQPIETNGITDLTLAGRKFSGNAQRRTRSHVLFHGTFLLAMDLERIDRVLPMPSRSPAYRAGRSHRDFITNLQFPASRLRHALQSHWNTNPHSPPPLQDAIARLLTQRYNRDDWNLRHSPPLSPHPVLRPGR
jgi:lipoate---protein ligase